MRHECYPSVLRYITPVESQLCTNRKTIELAITWDYRDQQKMVKYLLYVL